MVSPSSLTHGVVTGSEVHNRRSPVAEAHMQMRDWWAELNMALSLFAILCL